jgi:hypothetical protein
MTGNPKDRCKIKRYFHMLKNEAAVTCGICIVLFMLTLLLFPAAIKNGYCGEPMGITDDIKKIELREINRNQQKEDYFGYVTGHIPVLISAPHGTKHYRLSESRWRAEDAYTSSFAIKLGQLTGAYVIYAKNKSEEDPNSDIHCRYKEFLRKIVKENGIKFIIDIHGASRDRKFNIDVGTLVTKREESSCPTFMPAIEKAFLHFDDVIFNKHFQARGCGTITSFARNDLRIEAAQFEINALYRMMESRSNPAVTAKEQDVRDIMQRMQRMILDINEKITHDRAENRQKISLLHSSP